MKNMKITIIGSLKFKDEMKALANVLTLGGHLVFTAEDKFSGVSEYIGKEIYTEKYKPIIDEYYNSLIRMSDIVIVYNKDGYIGSSTMEGIMMAMSSRIELYFVENDPRFTLHTKDFIQQMWVKGEEDDTLDCILEKYTFWIAY